MMLELEIQNYSPPAWFSTWEIYVSFFIQMSEIKKLIIYFLNKMFADLSMIRNNITLQN